MINMKRVSKTILITMALSLAALSFAGCSTQKEQPEQGKLMIAAAASMEYSLENDLIPMFEEKYGIEIEGTYDSSGKLQQQIENGLEADVFLSAAEKQMDALSQEGFIDPSTAAPLLENKLVLITGGETDVTSFEDITKASVIAVGDPDVVPAGQYAKKVLEGLGLWDEVSSRASLGTNVTEVLNWTASNSAEVGIVYSTDAAQADVRVIAEAPSELLGDPIVYPIGILKNSSSRENAEKFIAFLRSDEARQVFERYGFTVSR